MIDKTTEKPNLAECSHTLYQQDMADTKYIMQQKCTGQCSCKMMGVDCGTVGASRDSGNTRSGVVASTPLGNLYKRARQW